MTRYRYTIVVREACSDYDIELCGVDTNPQNIVEALKEKTLVGSLTTNGKKKRLTVPKYANIRIVDNGEK
jgi:hypothetical protein